MTELVTESQFMVTLGDPEMSEHKPNKESRGKVMAFTCAGYAPIEIARYFGIGENVLTKFYAKELRESKMERISKISDKAYELAEAGKMKMIEYVLTHQGGWKKPEREIENTTETLIERIIDKL